MGRGQLADFHRGLSLFTYCTQAPHRSPPPPIFSITEICLILMQCRYVCWHSGSVAQEVCVVELCIFYELFELLWRDFGRRTEEADSCCTERTWMCQPSPDDLVDKWQENTGESRSASLTSPLSCYSYLSHSPCHTQTWSQTPLLVLSLFSPLSSPYQIHSLYIFVTHTEIKDKVAKWEKVWQREPQPAEVHNSADTAELEHIAESWTEVSCII